MKKNPEMSNFYAKSSEEQKKGHYVPRCPIFHLKSSVTAKKGHFDRKKMNKMGIDYKMKHEKRKKNEKKREWTACLCSKGPN